MALALSAGQLAPAASAAQSSGAGTQWGQSPAYKIPRRGAPVTHESNEPFHALPYAPSDTAFNELTPGAYAVTGFGEMAHAVQEECFVANPFGFHQKFPYFEFGERPHKAQGANDVEEIHDRRDEDEPRTSKGIDEGMRQRSMGVGQSRGWEYMLNSRSYREYDPDFSQGHLRDEEADKIQSLPRWRVSASRLALFASEANAGFRAPNFELAALQSMGEQDRVTRNPSGTSRGPLFLTHGRNAYLNPAIAPELRDPSYELPVFASQHPDRVRFNGRVCEPQQRAHAGYAPGGTLEKGQRVRAPAVATVQGVGGASGSDTYLAPGAHVAGHAFNWGGSSRGQASGVV